MRFLSYLNFYFWNHKLRWSNIVYVYDSVWPLLHSSIRYWARLAPTTQFCDNKRKADTVPYQTGIQINSQLYRTIQGDGLYWSLGYMIYTTFFIPKFLHFYTNVFYFFLHQNFCIFTPYFYFFYIKIFVFFTPIFFSSIFLLFYTNFSSIIPTFLN